MLRLPSARLARVDNAIADQNAQAAAGQDGPPGRNIEIHRGRGYADALRKYSVIIDGRRVGTLRGGQVARFRVDAGPHEVRLRIDWTGSHRVTVPAGGDDEVLEVRHAGWGAVGGIIDGEGWLELRRIG